MDNKYWIDDDGYIAHDTGDNYTTVSGLIHKEHIQEISLIFDIVPDLLDALKYYKEEYSGAEPSISVFERKIDQIMTRIEVKNG